MEKDYFEIWTASQFRKKFENTQPEETGIATIS
jgi:hypothetical protein